MKPQVKAQVKAQDKARGEVDDRDAEYQRLLTEADPEAVWAPWAAARFLGLSEQTLAHWRRLGTGPKFTRLSTIRIGYRRKSLIAYVASREFTSTAEEVSSAEGGTGSNPPVAVNSSRE